MSPPPPPGAPTLGSVRTSQQLLHDDHVHPCAVEPPLLAIHADGGEAEALVQRHPRRVEGECGQHHLVVAELTGKRDQALEKPPAYALAAPAALHVDGEVG